MPQKLVKEKIENPGVLPETEGMDFDNPSFRFVPKEQHEWRQQGCYLICKSCEITHAVYIGMGKLLIGLSPDGTPIFKSR